MKRKLTLLAAALAASPAFAAIHTTAIDAATYAGSYGTITFDDWGYSGPLGVGANDFKVGSDFDANQIGQVQKVVTKDPDYLTPDPGHAVAKDMTLLENPANWYSNANMDGSVNFYQWAYTTGGGSTFSNMQIDKAGNYYIARSDMSFRAYDMFYYRDTTGANPNASYDTKINFKPYTISDAGGWCGSVLGTGPAAVEKMAGQVTFDIAFDVYFDKGTSLKFSSTELIPGFVMRSYGSYEVSIYDADGQGQQHYTGSAVVNNTNPLTGKVDPAYANQVSFLGGGVIPESVWTSADSYNADGSRKMRTDINPTTGEFEQVWDVTIVSQGTPGAVLHTNSYAGYAFLMRADGTRILQQVGGEVYDPNFDYNTDRAAWTNYAPVPEAETWGMMLAGLGLVGAMTARRRRQIGAT